MMRRFAVAIVSAVLLACAASAAESDGVLRLHLRSRVETEPGSGRYHAIVKPAQWRADQTAIVICDMWDDHYCQNSARRVAEMAPHMNRVVGAARDRGVLIIHCPSGCMDQYENTPQRKLAQQAPTVETQIPLQRWCYLDSSHEAPLPIDDSIPCDDANPREKKRFYTRQIDAIKIHDGDAITDSAEAFYLMKQRGINNVIVMGVHTNMCVLGRPFSIRQMVYQGQNVVLMRDMTDSMYNPQMSPFVSHFSGNDLVVEHIERHWCPTVTSADFTGQPEFRFPRDKRPHLAIVMAESEYNTSETLPPFALKHLGHDFRVTLVYDNAADRNDIPGIDVLHQADVALLSIRRRTLPTAQLDVVRKFVADGKPLIAIRTASHAFCLRNEKPAEGLAEWPEFDREVLGGFYQNHHGNKLQTTVQALPIAADHPILAGVTRDQFTVFSSLYRSRPLADSATPLLTGSVAGDAPAEPVAWTNIRPEGGRVFYTSLGHPQDFELEDFQTLLKNGIYWAAGLEIPAVVASNSKTTAASAIVTCCE